MARRFLFILVLTAATQAVSANAFAGQQQFGRDSVYADGRQNAAVTSRLSRFGRDSVYANRDVVRPGSASLRVAAIRPGRA